MLGYLADDVCDLREGARSVVAVLLKSADHTRKLASVGLQATAPVRADSLAKRLSVEPLGGFES